MIGALMISNQARSSHFKVHSATVVVLIFCAGILLWANLRPTGWERELSLKPPRELDPITRWMFYRGWPVSPWMLCSVHGMKWHPEESFVQLALVVDGVVSIVMLTAVGVALEWGLRRWTGERLRTDTEGGARGSPSHAK